MTLPIGTKNVHHCFDDISLVRADSFFMGLSCAEENGAIGHVIGFEQLSTACLYFACMTLQISASQVVYRRLPIRTSLSLIKRWKENEVTCSMNSEGRILETDGEKNFGY
jgi:hypothetical protein